MKPYKIESSKTIATSNSNSIVHEIVSIEWINEDKYLNKNVFSLIDGKSMCGIKSLRIKNSFDYMSEKKSVRWSEIFLARVEESQENLLAGESSFNLNKFTESCAKAFAVALIPIVEDIINETLLILSTKAENKHLTMSLLDSEMFKIALRIQIDRDFVGYLVGAYGLQINDAKYLSNFDNELIPLLYQANEFNVNLNLELVFLVLDRYNFYNE